jgi:hypothetical protein
VPAAPFIDGSSLSGSGRNRLVAIGRQRRFYVDLALEGLAFGDHPMTL